MTRGEITTVSFPTRRTSKGKISESGWPVFTARKPQSFRDLLIETDKEFVIADAAGWITTWRWPIENDLSGTGVSGFRV